MQIMFTCFELVLSNAGALLLTKLHKLYTSGIKNTRVTKETFDSKMDRKFKKLPTSSGLWFLIQKYVYTNGDIVLHTWLIN